MILTLQSQISGGESNGENTSALLLSTVKEVYRKHSIINVIHSFIHSPSEPLVNPHYICIKCGLDTGDAAME